MKFKSPSLPELHAFLAVCQLGSFSRAALVLFVTQAAVSRAVQRLEQRLECNLFDRTAAGVTPTARGRAFQSLVETHVAGLEEAMAHFTSGNKAMVASKSKLRLSLIPTLGTRWLMPRLAQFQSAYPDIAVELRQFHHDEDFRRDDVDVWIDVKRPKAWPRGYQAEYLLGKEMAPVCIPAIAARLKTAQDLLAETLLHHTNFPDNWAVWLRGAGLRHAKPVLGAGFDLGNNLIVAACAGMGVTVIQPCLIENELATGQLVMPFNLLVSTGRGYYVCYRSTQSQSPAVETFVAWLQTQVKTGLLSPSAC
ncbi:LysR substrate-binding domain-containing protein [Rhodoferax ferrireducens]|uniref:LysR substrate-binding domain-containing protein n=1 Tax=Rhodoferax ferrireducens TaxID=192843 RepID=UPI000E0D3AF8|nr:LysR substrate-binding domain-containing protein [Rhodoferax ferrireducens]